LYGKTLSKIDKWFPSSKLCSGCGNKKKDLADRTYQCDVCGLSINRDLNASINILTAGTAGIA
jgi:putative transposase